MHYYFQEYSPGNQIFSRDRQPEKYRLYLHPWALVKDQLGKQLQQPILRCLPLHTTSSYQPHQSKRYQSQKTDKG